MPLPGHLHAHREQLIELADLGYTDIWSAEADAADAFTPLAMAAAWEPRLRLGTAIVPAYTRSPACMAQCAATLADGIMRWWSKAGRINIIRLPKTRGELIYLTQRICA